MTTLRLTGSHHAIGAGDKLGRPPPWFRSSTNAAFSLSSYNAAQLDVTYRSPLTKGEASRILNEASELPKPSWISRF